MKKKNIWIIVIISIVIILVVTFLLVYFLVIRKNQNSNNSNKPPSILYNNEWLFTISNLNNKRENTLINVLDENNNIIATSNIIVEADSKTIFNLYNQNNLIQYQVTYTFKATFSNNLSSSISFTTQEDSILNSLVNQTSQDGYLFAQAGEWIPISQMEWENLAATVQGSIIYGPSNIQNVVTDVIQDSGTYFTYPSITIQPSVFIFGITFVAASTSVKENEFQLVLSTLANTFVPKKNSLYFTVNPIQNTITLQQYYYIMKKSTAAIGDTARITVWVTSENTLPMMRIQENQRDTRDGLAIGPFQNSNVMTDDSSGNFNQISLNVIGSKTVSWFN